MPPSDFYVYTVTVDGVVLYIGKGRRWRHKEHIYTARTIIRKRDRGEAVKCSVFHGRLADAITSGMEVLALIVARGLSEPGAYELERDMIAGATDGSLWNTQRGGRGGSSEDWLNPDLRARYDQSRVEMRARPEYRRHLSEGIRQSHSRPEFRQAQANGSRSKWSDPDYRARRAAAFARPDVRARIAEAARRGWEKRRGKA